MKRRSALFVIAGLVGCLALMMAPVLEANPTAEDAPDDPLPRLVVFELFNRSESGG